MIGIELRERAQPALKTLAERGVLALTAGNNVIRLVPPLVIEDEQLEQVAAALAEVLR
jgi:acetylornithine/LysW-gamma-L-lysine aminotransferase